MARGVHVKTGGEVKLDLGELSPKQVQFMESTCRYTAYGGARGGGKTHVLLRKAVFGCLNYPGLKILIIRRTYPELEKTIIEPMIRLVNTATEDGKQAGQKIGRYNGSLRTMYFSNGSMVVFGHLQSANAITEYQGQEYDWIFMDEATHFTEWEFRTLGATMRGVNKFPKRFHLTCNPGGIGHNWVKRLFVTRQYNPGENGDDYKFIPATVEDNTALMEASPEYVAMLDMLPPDLRAAHRFGDWDALSGQFFGEFRVDKHITAGEKIPDAWPRYRAFDYGLDMFACYWAAIDFEGRIHVYREYCESGLIVTQAASAMHELTPPGEKIEFTIAPPDMWSTQKDTGKTMAEIFAQSGIGLVKASNQRVQGWMAVKEALKIREDGKAGLTFDRGCLHIISDIQSIQHDEKNPSDVAKEPHDITHSPDAIRYLCVTRAMAAHLEKARLEDDEDDEDEAQDYERAMCGGAITQSYLSA